MLLWWSIGVSLRHADTVMRRLEADAFPAFGHKSIHAVTAADVRELMLTMERRDAMKNYTILYALYRLGYQGRMT